MAAQTDVLVKMAGTALLRVGLSRYAMPALNPGYRVIAWFARMAVKAGRIFVAHRTALRI